eukprot:CAMPEP_0175442328 /NCGR_PEP_ID=MMETSP0095-20121207/58090_1 /TAXON_ID=311494 /ORGANISM="Alexandrium monilatum, Strain CCMP3105" /LENGTH=295 /DNA_ID=CAMNT_0016742351 /DNA_START=112 /DNA_END=995 /DNA_ORIENTATION=-
MLDGKLAGAGSLDSCGTSSKPTHRSCVRPPGLKDWKFGALMSASAAGPPWSCRALSKPPQGSCMRPPGLGGRGSPQRLCARPPGLGGTGAGALDDTEAWLGGREPGTDPASSKSRNSRTMAVASRRNSNTALSTIDRHCPGLGHTTTAPSTSVKPPPLTELPDRPSGVTRFALLPASSRESLMFENSSVRGSGTASHSSSRSFEEALVQSVGEALGAAAVAMPLPVAGNALDGQSPFKHSGNGEPPLLQQASQHRSSGEQSLNGERLELVSAPVLAGRPPRLGGSVVDRLSAAAA